MKTIREWLAAIRDLAAAVRSFEQAVNSLRELLDRAAMTRIIKLEEQAKSLETKTDKEGAWVFQHSKEIETLQNETGKLRVELMKQSAKPLRKKSKPKTERK